MKISMLLFLFLSLLIGLHNSKIRNDFIIHFTTMKVEHEKSGVLEFIQWGFLSFDFLQLLNLFHNAAYMHIEYIATWFEFIPINPYVRIPVFSCMFVTFSESMKNCTCDWFDLFLTITDCDFLLLSER